MHTREVEEEENNGEREGGRDGRGSAEWRHKRQN